MAQSNNLAEMYASIDALLDYAHECLDLDGRDMNVARNRILSVFSLESYRSTGASPLCAGSDALMERFCDAAMAAGLCDADDLPSLCDTVMGILSASPSGLQDSFIENERSRGAMAAMQWFYDYCVSNTYVKKMALDQNPRFDSHGLVITINLAKPEFKDMSKAATGNSMAGGYPQCTICHENEGFAGRDKRTLRTIPVTLGGKPWFWQFSPYGYFHQHGICVNMEHTPMHVDRATFINLLDFIDRFPGFFLGCNAALERIGGSVLAHDHYQGGGETLPMHRASAWLSMHMKEYPEAHVEILDWMGTAIRVISHSRRDIIEVSEVIRNGWSTYTNRDLNIVCEGEGGLQSAVSPSAIITDRGYEMNLILRNNAVSKELPDGIFHAHPEYYAIKQEPIGLIEAQGLFILPKRLIAQLDEIEDTLAKGGTLPAAEAEFALEWEELARQLDGSRDRGTIRAAIRDELGSVCARILENTAVFKRKEYTQDFLENLGFRAE